MNFSIPILFFYYELNTIFICNLNVVFIVKFYLILKIQVLMVGFIYF